MKPAESKERLWQAIRRNDRLEQYKELIAYAREENYEILPLEEFYLLSPEEKRATRHLILRHDVDISGPSIEKMFETEKELGVLSTYYFRDCTVDVPLIKKMKDAGFEVGYHCESVSNYADQKGCKTKQDVNMDEVRDLFASELAAFEERIGFKTRSCCGHGRSVCRRLRITNGQHLEDADLTRFGLLFEAYDRDLYENYLDSHIMDIGLTCHYGYAYPETVNDAIEKGYNNILFLAHPNHWYLSVKDRLRFTRELLTGKASFTTERSFRRVYEN